jgi:vitamin B12 transporter
MRSGTMVLLLMLGSGCFAQQQDSVLLRQVVVYGILDEKYLAGSSLLSQDSSVRRQYSSQHLGEVLSLEFPIYFRNYGNGMISGISLRGTSPSHTAVLWNGININSFSLGQADFSMLPVTAFEDVKVHEGGGSSLFGSGALGGTVLLNSSGEEAPPLTITQEVASFGRYFTSVRRSWNMKGLNFKTKFYHHSSDNDFPVKSTGDRQQHASFLQWGVLQDIEYQWSSAKALSVHYWYHDANRNIQPPVGQSVTRGDEQQDENHRLSVQYKSNGRRGMFSVMGGYVQDVIIYNRDRSVVSRWTAESRYQVVLPWKVSSQFGVTWNNITARIRQYRNGGRAEEDRFDFLASFQKYLGTRLSLALNLRQPMVTGFNAPFLPYLGAEYTLLKKTNNALQVRANASKNYRVPTLNDRNWGVDGRKDLLPETSVATEVGLQWRNRNLMVENTFFRQRIDQWIQWLPDNETRRYRPQNAKQVVIEGFEAKINWRKSVGAVKIIPMITYQFTKSVTTKALSPDEYTVGKQLIYTPRHTAAGNIQAIFRKYSAGFSIQYNSERFSDFSNADLFALPQFVVMNLSAGRFWMVGRHRLDVIASSRNIAAEEYQLYAGRALPGRHYTFQLTYQLNRAQNED